MEKMGAVGYIIPFAKMRGETSFASIGLLKRLLGTKKVGHTGTLDSFADGLLVAVSGKLTRLASFIEAGLKRYEARLVFGIETDTLEFTGEVVRRANLPTYEKVREIIGSFSGKIMQVPPQFSALHVGGRRASDIVRSGGSVELEEREVEIKEIIVKGALFSGDSDFVDVVNLENCKERFVKELHIEVECSKGTYIRALARDIGIKSGSASYLKALRRLSVACFSLENAFRSSSLPHFLTEEKDVLSPILTSSCLLNEAKIEEKENRYSLEALVTCARVFSADLCKQLNIPVLEVKREFVKSFTQGKEIKDYWFYNDGRSNTGYCSDETDITKESYGIRKAYSMQEKREDILKKGVGFVFCEDEALGAVLIEGSRYKYKFVL